MMTKNFSRNNAAFINSIQTARVLRHSRRTLGEDGIYQHVEDVDSNWLENWSDESNPALDIAGNISPNGQNLPTQTN